MRSPIFLHPLTDAGRSVLEDHLLAPAAVILRRCFFLRSTARGERAHATARRSVCAQQSARTAGRACQAQAIGALTPQTPRRRTIHIAFDPAGSEAGEALFVAPLAQSATPTGSERCS